MLQWPQLTILLLLRVMVSGRELRCDIVDPYKCWNSQTHTLVDCWRCTIKNQQILDNEVEIASNHANGTAADVKIVIFNGGDVTKLPKITHEWSNKQILNVQLWKTNTRALNAQFFGIAAQNIKAFYSWWNDVLSVAADAFRNCTALEVLDLGRNRISSIPPDTFRGLRQLVWLNLNWNQLTAINENWFDDLGNLEILNLGTNQLPEIPDAAFDKLRKLKVLSLEDNKIEILSRRMFHNNQQLQIIFLYENQIKVIESGSFSQLPMLSLLKLKQNKCIDSEFIYKKSEEFIEALTACQPSICLIPQIPNGFIVSTIDNVRQIVGDSFEEYNPVKVVCLPSFSLFHERANQTANECQEEVWINEKWPECHRK